MTKARNKMDDYEVGTRLRHHSGSVWEVEATGLPDGASEGYYRIRCVAVFTHPGFTGREQKGTALRCHPDYLHGDGWRVEEPKGAAA